MLLPWVSEAELYSERSSVFKLILKFGSVWFVFKSISQKCSLECWRCCYWCHWSHVGYRNMLYQRSMSTDCCHSCPVLSGPSAISKFLHWNMNWWNFGNWELDWRVCGRWLETDLTFVWFLCQIWHVHPCAQAHSDRASVSQCFTFTNDWQSSWQSSQSSQWWQWNWVYFMWWKSMWGCEGHVPWHPSSLTRSRQVAMYRGAQQDFRSVRHVGWMHLGS